MPRDKKSEGPAAFTTRIRLSDGEDERRTPPYLP